MAEVSAVTSLRTPVWDLPVRLFHWSLLLAVAIAAITGFLLPLNWLNLHLIGGTAVAALLLFRLVWGFTGSAHSRFASFAFSPAAVLRHVRSQLRGNAPHHTGHNPVGAVMIFALLATLFVLVLTGTLALGGTEKQGPLRAIVTYASGRFALSIHELAAYGLLLLVLGHVAGVVIESRRSGENLPRAMVTGRKRHADGSPHPAASPAVATVTLVISAALLAVPGYALWQIPPAGTPGTPMDAAYAKACGDCHAVFHPSLRNAATWRDMMASLDGHFGEDASLGAEELKSLMTYLEANAAEHWDTRAANVFRINDPADPLRITATAFWRHRHEDIDPAVFNREKVGTKSNCDACHGDAGLGRFAPQAIHIPEENMK